MAESGKFPRGHRNSPYSILKENPQECSSAPPYYITSTFPICKDSVSLPIPKSDPERRSPRLPDPLNEEEIEILAEPARHGAYSSCQELAQVIEITHNPVVDAGGQRKSEIHSAIGIPVPSSPAAGIRTTFAPVAGELHDTAISISRKRMDLPRGRFRALKKNTCLLILLPELHVTAFTGYCRINLGRNTTILVFEKGKIILAEHDGLGGDAALDRICAHIYCQVDVLLNDLDEGQIRLALEFNPTWGVSMEQSLPSFSCYEPCPVPPAEPVEAMMNRKADLQDTKIIEIEENPEVSVSVERVQETDKVHSPMTSESHMVPESSDMPDWKRALGMPVVGARETTVHEVAIEERQEPELPDELGWKKALLLPVKAMNPVIQESLSDGPRASAMAGMSAKSEVREQGQKFDPISPDSGLLEEKPVKKRVSRVKYPEPAEQWKFMNVNRGQNTSV